METIAYQTIPKVELHCHLDGSLRPETAWEYIQKHNGFDIATYQELERRMRVTDSCQSLVEYLSCFDLPLRCLQTPEMLHRAAMELVLDAAADGVIYIEVRFAPQLHRQEGLSLDAVVEAVCSGLTEAAQQAHMEARAILSCMRNHSVEQNLAVVAAAQRAVGRGVVGLDLAGDEAGYPALLHAEVFEKAQALGIPFTIHAGESAGPESVKEALLLGAKRLGHGTHLRDDPALVSYCKRHRIGLEMCPSSNIQTHAVAGIGDFPLCSYAIGGLLVTVNTDNRTVSNTTISNEYRVLAACSGLTENMLRQLTENAIELSFAEPSVKECLLERVRTDAQ